MTFHLLDDCSPNYKLINFQKVLGVWLKDYSAHIADRFLKILFFGGAR